MGDGPAGPGYQPSFSGIGGNSGDADRMYIPTPTDVPILARGRSRLYRYVQARSPQRPT
jgi:hypothetical protein